MVSTLLIGMALGAPMAGALGWALGRWHLSATNVRLLRETEIAHSLQRCRDCWKPFSPEARPKVEDLTIPTLGVSSADEAGGES